MSKLKSNYLHKKEQIRYDILFHVWLYAVTIYKAMLNGFVFFLFYVASIMTRIRRVVSVFNL